LVALVNIGHETTNLDLLADGMPVLVRDVPFGSRRLREALQRERGLTAEQAEAVIQGKDTTVDLRSFVSDRVDELAVGVERAVAFVMSQGGMPALGQVYVCGGGGRVPGIVDALGARLNVRAEVANPVQRIGIRPDVLQGLELDEFAPMLMLPVGLALRLPR
jgi:type IV pilus assembly protein PilM